MWFRLVAWMKRSVIQEKEVISSLFSPGFTLRFTQAAGGIRDANTVLQICLISSLIVFKILNYRGVIMGLTHADLKLTNLIGKQSITVSALVDTGATFMCVTEEVAAQLGFDIEEVSTYRVTLADGRQIKAPRLAPIEIAFANRTYVTEALVLGNEPLMGALPLEAMDLMEDPLNQQLVVNPAHPNFPVALAK
jgi:clan AA aspartic protease